MFDLFYQRPKLVRASGCSFVAEEDVEKYLSTRSSSASSESVHIAGIPPSLSFERILTTGTCPPCTIRDFMNYLKYVEHGAENLQFYLWLNDYEKRFSELGDRDKSLSPKWTKELAAVHATVKQDPTSISTQQLQGQYEAQDDVQDTTPIISDAMKNSGSLLSTPLDTPPRTPAVQIDMAQYWDDPASKRSQDKMPADYKETAANAFKSVNLQWQPCNIQPFRDEIARIIALYIVEGSSRELNLTASERRNVLCALEHTTHYSVFHNLKVTVEWTLRNQSHPNFIRWAICNGNRPRVVFARGLGVSLITIGLLMAFLFTLSNADRGWRAFAAILLVLGIATLVSAWKGMCVVLHGLHARQLKPWELFPTEGCKSDTEAGGQIVGEHDQQGFESEPWIRKYEKRNPVRKIFDKQVWVEEPALRSIQNSIFVQSLLIAICITAVVVGVFLAIPKGRFF